VREDSLRAHIKMHSKEEFVQNSEFLASAQIQAQDVVYFLPVKTADNFPTCTLLGEYPTESEFILMPVTSNTTTETI